MDARKHSVMVVSTIVEDGKLNKEKMSSSSSPSSWDTDDVGSIRSSEELNIMEDVVLVFILCREDVVENNESLQLLLLLL